MLTLEIEFLREMVSLHFFGTFGWQGEAREKVMRGFPILFVSDLKE